MSQNPSMEDICARAAAWKAKYCEMDPYGQPLLIDIGLSFLCVHPGNRGFVYTQGKACKALMRGLGIDGFLQAKVNSSPVVVMERPVEGRSGNYESFLAYNIRKSNDDELLAGAYLDSDPVLFANLNHCHALNTGRAVIRKLPWGHDVFPPELGLRACDADGNLSISALAAHPNMAEMKDWIVSGFQGCTVLTVSYTHLTLPTIYSV